MYGFFVLFFSHYQQDNWFLFIFAPPPLPDTDTQLSILGRISTDTLTQPTVLRQFYNYVEILLTLGHDDRHQIFPSDQVIVLGLGLRLTLPVLFDGPHQAGVRHDRDDGGKDGRDNKTRRDRIDYRVGKSNAVVCYWRLGGLKRGGVEL